MANKSEITGAVGVEPPPDAPREHAQPLQPETLAIQQERAKENERPLAPFKHQNKKPIQLAPAVPAPPVEQPTQAPPVSASTEALIDNVFGETPSVDPESVHEAELPTLTEEDRLRMPAASDTDTPSKGLLPNLTPPKGDKFDGISRGGFSDVGEAQYFPLTGDELKELVLALMDDLAARIPNDLRFSMALTYPRVRAIVKVEIEGHAEDGDAGFVIEKVFAPKDGAPGSTPQAIANQRADQVCFVVKASRQEFTPDGESDLPPDAIRDELGLSKPRKTIIEHPGGRQTFVDIASPGSDLPAVMR